MTPRWRTAVLLVGASLLISTTAVRSTRAERASGDARAEIPIAQAGYVGFGGCATSQCHTAVKDWALKLDGEGGGKKTHYNALNQLDAGKYPDVKKFLAAVNAKDAYSERSCLDCHSTPDASGDIEGVTCEKCHGPGKLYKDKHDKVKGAGAGPYTALGMIDYQKTPKRWVPLCINCHVLGSSAKHQALAKEGHPTGADFDITKAFLRVKGPPGSHWATRNYTAAEVAAAAPARPRPAAAPAPVTPPPATAAPTPAPPTAAPATTPVTAPATPVANPSPPPGPGTRPVVTAAPAPVTAIVPPVPPAIKPVVTPKVTPVVAPVVASPAAPADPRPMPASDPPVTSAPLVGTPPAEPRTMSGLIASVQGRLINVLTSLLRQNASVPQRVVPPAKPAVYSGPDRDLLKLQDDIISLALEVLGKAPGKGGGSQ